MRIWTPNGWVDEALLTGRAFVARTVTQSDVAEQEDEIATLHRLADRHGIAGHRTYFIGAADGPVKIGYTSSVRQRLRELQQHHPEEPLIHALAFGGRDRERAYHAQFASLRIRGEWFARERPILAEIARLNGPTALAGPVFQ